MKLQTIKIGQTYPFVSRKNHGRGKVTDIETKTTGAWITLHDKGKDKSFIVRPSQVGVTPEAYRALVGDKAKPAKTASKPAGKTASKPAGKTASKPAAKTARKR